jgi:hypothetical protein
MIYPRASNLTDAAMTGAASIDYLTGLTAAPISLGGCQQGPVTLYYQLECLSAATVSGIVTPMFMYTSRDGLAQTASGRACTLSAASSTAGGIINLNLASNSTIGFCISATEQIQSASACVTRYSIGVLGGERPLGMIYK